jgi:hypothetical protein
VDAAFSANTSTVSSLSLALANIICIPMTSLPHLSVQGLQNSQKLPSYSLEPTPDSAVQSHLAWFKLSLLFMSSCRIRMLRRRTLAASAIVRQEDSFVALSVWQTCYHTTGRAYGSLWSQNLRMLPDLVDLSGTGASLLNPDIGSMLNSDAANAHANNEIPAGCLCPGAPCASNRSTAHLKVYSHV